MFENYDELMQKIAESLGECGNSIDWIEIYYNIDLRSGGGHRRPM